MVKKEHPPDPLIRDLKGKRLVEASQYLGPFRKGGKIRKTGVALIHKGEKILQRKEKRDVRRKGRS